MSDSKHLPTLDRPPTYRTIDPSVTSQPENDTGAEAPANSQPSSNTARELEIHRPGLPSSNGLLIKSGGNALYYASHYIETADLPDVILYAGYDIHGPRLAQTKFILHSKDFKIFVGDHRTPSNYDWDVVRESGGGMFHDPQHRFEIRYKVPGGERVKRRFYWQKTSDSKLGASRFSPRDFKLVDEETGSIVAAYIERYGGGHEHRGTIRLFEDLPEYPQVATLMVLLSLLEKTRRWKKAVQKAFPNNNAW